MMKHNVTYYDGGVLGEGKAKPSKKSMVTARESTDVENQKRGEYVKNKKGKNNYYNLEPMR